MKNLVKTSAAILISISLIYTACKKTETPANATPKVDELSIAKQIGISFYNSVAGGTNGFKSASVDGKRVLSTTPPTCGQVIVTPTNSTAIVNDTTRKIVGNSIFTYVCNNNILNAYTLADTLSVTETGSAFNDSYSLTQNYTVTLDGSNPSLSHTNGTMTAVNVKTRINSSNVITESHRLSAQYTLTDVQVQRNGNDAKIVFGATTFSSQAIDKDATTGANGNLTSFTGKIVFLGNDSVWVIFDNGDGTNRVYLVNLKTGETKKIFPV